MQADDMEFSNLQDLFGTTYMHTDFILIAGKEVLDMKELFKQVKYI
ncbi:hypothetical protein V7127_03110 [Bacillus sp. JJ1773]